MELFQELLEHLSRQKIAGSKKAGADMDVYFSFDPELAREPGGKLDWPAGDEVIVEKALSKVQRRFFGIALRIKRGDMSISDLNPSNFEDGQKGVDNIARIVRDMPEEKIRDFAKGKETGLPTRVKKRK